MSELRNVIAAMEQSMSLRQIHLNSGVNYVTLRNIRNGTSTRVTEKVYAAVMEFYRSFTTAPAAVPATASTRPSKRKAGKRTGTKSIAVKNTALPPAAHAHDMTFQLHGDTLKREIEILEARVQYLKSLLKAEEDFLKAIGGG
jgi:hypothetical protein